MCLAESLVLAELYRSDSQLFTLLSRKYCKLRPMLGSWMLLLGRFKSILYANQYSLVNPMCDLWETDVHPQRF